jgi:hypothetical protein
LTSQDDAYWNSVVHEIPRPVPVHRGDWWFRKWTVTAPSFEGIAGFSMPAPPGGFTGVASVVFASAGHVVVELGEPCRELSADALTYAATVVSELRCRLGEGTTVDGDTRHTLFLLVKWDCHQDEAHQRGPVRAHESEEDV